MVTAATAASGSVPIYSGPAPSDGLSALFSHNPETKVLFVQEVQWES